VAKQYLGQKLAAFREGPSLFWRKLLEHLRDFSNAPLDALPDRRAGVAGQPHQHNATVPLRPLALDEAQLDKALDDLRCRSQGDTHPTGKLAHRQRFLARQAPERADLRERQALGARSAARPPNPPDDVRNGIDDRHQVVRRGLFRQWKLFRSRILYTL